MKKHEVLFVQGAGAGAHEEDLELVKSLRQHLGQAYHVRYPRVPNDGDSAYGSLKAVIVTELAAIADEIVLVGHSAGGSVLMKYLSEERIEHEIAGVFLIATPYFGPGGWEVEDSFLRQDFVGSLPKNTPLFFYHSRDDEVVPFAQLALYARAVPRATVRTFDGRGHQFKNDLSEVATDIKGLRTNS